jgi:hypothetical protein
MTYSLDGVVYDNSVVVEVCGLNVVMLTNGEGHQCYVVNGRAEGWHREVGEFQTDNKGTYGYVVPYISGVGFRSLAIGEFPAPGVCERGVTYVLNGQAVEPHGRHYDDVGKLRFFGNGRSWFKALSVSQQGDDTKLMCIVVDGHETPGWYNRVAGLYSADDTRWDNLYESDFVTFGNNYAFSVFNDGREPDSDEPRNRFASRTAVAWSDADVHGGGYVINGMPDPLYPHVFGFEFFGDEEAPRYFYTADYKIPTRLNSVSMHAVIVDGTIVGRHRDSVVCPKFSGNRYSYDYSKFAGGVDNPSGFCVDGRHYTWYDDIYGHGFSNGMHYAIVRGVNGKMRYVIEGQEQPGHDGVSNKFVSNGVDWAYAFRERKTRDSHEFRPWSVVLNGKTLGVGFRYLDIKSMVFDGERQLKIDGQSAVATKK